MKSIWPVIVILFLKGCVNGNEGNFINRNWALYAVYGVDSNKINQGDYYKNGFQVNFSKELNVMSVYVFNDHIVNAQYEFYAADSTIYIYDADEKWLNGEYRLKYHRPKKPKMGAYEYMFWNDRKGKQLLFTRSFMTESN